GLVHNLNMEKYNQAYLKTILGASPADIISLRPLSGLMMSSQHIYLTSVRMFSVDNQKIMDANFNIVRIYHSTGLLICLIFFFISWLKTVENVIPELHEMHIAHFVSVGSESLCTLNPDCGDGYIISL
ncbi:hypothetical protein H5410_014768, partial [Solanum commersonii]